MSLYKESDIVKPVDLDKVLSDTLLNDSAKATIKALDGKGVITQVKENDEGESLNYVAYVDKDLNWITQVYKDNEIKKEGN